ncbi:hypothetical protein BC628DRAFT_1353158 [Trametes gibbosa]|nr:hypothetical protein BC628DRAFT_1353158 [Trametes gibbosa]
MPLGHRGYGAYISCDGQELEQFCVKVENDNTVSCYVPVDTGTEYKVHWIDSKPPTHLSVEVRADGRRVGVVSHRKGSSTTIRPGLKVPLDTTSDFLHIRAADDAALPAAYSEELGVIEVRLRRVRDFITVPFPSKAAGPGPRRLGGSSAPGIGFRGGSVKSASSGSRKENRQKATVMRPILIDDKPHAVFRFLYRPAEVMEANGIKPFGQSTSSSTAASKRQKRTRGKAPTSLAVVDVSGQHPPKRRRHISEYLEPGTSETFSSKNENIDDNGTEFLRDPSPVLVAPDVVMEDELEEEKTVEIHPSSRDRHVSSIASHCPSPFKVESEVFSVKRELALEALPSAVSWGRLPSGTETDTKPKVEIEEYIEDSIIEVHITSRNRHAIFGTSRHGVYDQATLVKKEESPERTLMLGCGRDVKYEEQEPVLEVHMSATAMRSTGLVGAGCGNTVKAEARP